MKVKRVLCVQALFLSGGSPAAAQPQPVQPAQSRPDTAASSGQGAQQSPEPRSDDIVVRAPRQDGSSIDRETYVVRDTPLAQARTAVEVLQSLPSVTVDSSGQLRLLGTRSVRILVDGREMPNAAAFVATLQASQIARIEVMTNPSAQYSAYGSGGIINIVLRRDFADGLGGSVVAGAGTQGYVNLRLSPTLATGRWTLSLSPSLLLGTSQTDRSLHRSGLGSSPAPDRTEIERSTGSSRSVSATNQISYLASERERYDFTGAIGRQVGVGRRTLQVSAPGGPFERFEQRAGGRVSGDTESLSLERKITGPRERQEFRLGLSWSHAGMSSRTHFIDILPSGNRRLELDHDYGRSALGLKLDHVRPLGEGLVLSVGAEMQRESESMSDAARGETDAGPADTRETFSGSLVDLSGYATLQTRIGSLRALPGLRIQHRRFDIGSGAGAAPAGGTLLFPTLHLERAFGPLTTTFSIASRADWPSIVQFNPHRRVTGPTTIDSGNPGLRPERSFNIEAGGRLQVSDQQLSFTLYARRRSNAQAAAVEVTDDSEILSVPVNSGTRLSRGGQISLRGRLCATCRYSASAWVSDARFDRLDGAVLRRGRALEYGGNAQFDYSHGEQGKRGYRQLTATFRYFGPTKSLQSETSALASGDISYVHFLRDRLSIVATATRLVGDRSVATIRFSPDFAERSVSEIPGPQFRVSLTYNLGQ